MSTALAPIEGYGPPTTKTVGAVGQIYKDLNTGTEYVCVKAIKISGYKISKESYTWEKKAVDVLALLETHMHELEDILDVDALATDDEVDAAVDELRKEIDIGISGGEGINIFAEIVD